MKAINEAVEKHEGLILEAERYIWQNPETGFKEFKTSAYMAEKFRELGYTLTMAEGITGFYTVIDTGREGPEVLVLGELDSIICPNHPESDKTTGAVHSCGHNAQCAALLGIAAALKEPGILDGLSGKIRLCAVPAEELLEIEYRSELMKEGKISYFGGKSEFLSRGYFDGVDMALMIHTSARNAIIGGMNGCIAKHVTYKGKASHAGGAPWLGVNALYAASCGLNAVNALRETFREPDSIRVHPIITSGGSIVNAIPETVRLESYVRGRSFEAMARENEKVNRALTGAAYSLGANIEINDIPGYAPLNSDPNLIELARRAFLEILPDEELYFEPTRFNTASTDMGDLSSIMPVVHPNCRGNRGTSHGADYYIENPRAACVNSAKWQLAILKLLLSDGAAEAKRIKSEYKPPFATKKEFLDYVGSLRTSGDRIIYNQDGTATVK